MTQWGLDTLFNPAKRHMDEEKRRLQSTREEVGDSSGGKRIDLESGKVRIRRTGRAARDDQDSALELIDGAAAAAPDDVIGDGAPGDGAAGDGAAGDGAAGDGAPEDGAAATSRPRAASAAERAAARRRRAAR